MIEVVRLARRLFERSDWLRWWATGFLALAISAVEMAAAVAMLQVLRVVSGQEATDPPVIGAFFAAGSELRPVALTAAVAFGLRAALHLLHAHVQFRFAFNFGARLAARLMRGYLDRPYAWHLGRNSSELLTHVIQSTTNVAVYVVAPSTAMTAQILMIAALGSLLVVTDAEPALGAALSLGVIVVASIFVVRRQLARLGARDADEYRRSVLAVQEGLADLRTVKISQLAADVTHRVAAARNAHARVNFMRSTIAAAPRVVIETSALLGVLAFLVVRWDPDQGADALATLGLFAYALVRMLPTVNSLVTNINQIQYGLPALRAITADIDAAPPSGEERTTSAPQGLDVVFEGVSYTYDDATSPALHDVTLGIPFGMSVGVVGRTGSGKSTFLDLFTGLLDPQSGQVTVGGEPMARVRSDWQRHIAIVPQTVTLLDDTIRHNITVGHRGAEPDDQALQDALRASQLTELVEALPHGLDTVVGERGVRLSGGQRQRLALARALYRRPDVLLLDEGTAALDTETEGHVIEAVRGIGGPRTLVMVAHRLTTVQDCDLIVVIDEGAVVGLGTYGELERSNAAFRRLMLPV